MALSKSPVHPSAADRHRAPVWSQAGGPRCRIGGPGFVDRTNGHRRRITNRRQGTRGGGSNAERGRGRPAQTAKVRAQRRAPGASGPVQRRTTWSWRTTWALTRRLPEWSRRCNSALMMAKGGLATTWKGRRGRRRSAPSASTTISPRPKRRRSCAALPGWLSTAMTLAPAVIKGSVSAPRPAPTSSTRAPRLRPASATIRSAQRESSWCHPQVSRALSTATNRHEVGHRPSLAAIASEPG
jgi:hypothetical protein